MFFITGYPVRACLWILEFPIIGTDCHSIHQFTFIMPATENCQCSAKSPCKLKCWFLLVCYNSDKHCSCQSISIHLHILTQKAGTHAVSQHKVRHLRIFLRRPLTKCMHISDHACISIFFIKKSILRLALHRFSMS